MLWKESFVRYLIGTKDKGLIWDPHGHTFDCFVDASFANFDPENATFDPSTSKTRTGYKCCMEVVQWCGPLSCRKRHVCLQLRPNMECCLRAWKMCCSWCNCLKRLTTSWNGMCLLLLLQSIARLSKMTLQICCIVVCLRTTVELMKWPGCPKWGPGRSHECVHTSFSWSSASEACFNSQRTTGPLTTKSLPNGNWRILLP